MSAPRVCALVPTYNNPLTIRTVVDGLRAHNLEVIVVDDGSDDPGKNAVAELSARPGVTVVSRAQNGGKGTAVQEGFERARGLGFSHALQMDADGQHTLDDVPRFVEACQRNPEALILGHPLFDSSAPRGRVIGRKLSVFWCAIETGGLKIIDPLCGFRVYPLEACARLGRQPARMDFDPEIAVRLVWAGTPTVNLPTRVRYLRAEEGGVSNFHMLRDNVRISWMHTKLCTLGILLVLTWPVRRLFRGGSA